MEILQPRQLLEFLQQEMSRTIFIVKQLLAQGVAVWQRLMRKDFLRNNVMTANENDKNENDLFREAIKGANPLKISLKKKEYKAPQKKPKPVPLNFLRDERQALIDSISDHYDPLHDIENGEELFYVKQGHSPDLLKKLRKGYWVVQKSIDLHGMISAEAKAQETSSSYKSAMEARDAAIAQLELDIAQREADLGAMQDTNPTPPGNPLPADVTAILQGAVVQAGKLLGTKLVNVLVTVNDSAGNSLYYDPVGAGDAAIEADHANIALIPIALFN